MTCISFVRFIPVNRSVMCDSATPWTTVVHLVLLSKGFSRQEYWSWLPFSFPGDFPDPGVKPGSFTLQAVSLLTKPSGKTLDLFLGTDDF